MEATGRDRILSTGILRIEITQGRMASAGRGWALKNGWDPGGRKAWGAPW